MDTDILAQLYRTILARRTADPQQSYTAQLLASGKDRPLAKYQEEAQELLDAAHGGDKGAIVHESADLLYHWLVLLAACDVPLADVLQALQARTGVSGLTEKSARPSRKSD